MKTRRSKTLPNVFVTTGRRGQLFLRFGKTIKDAESLRSVRFPEDACVGVVGSLENAAVIVELSLLAESGQIEGVCLCSPRIVLETQGTFVELLMRLSNPALQTAPSIGGWHRMTDFEVPIYCAAAKLMQQQDPSELVNALQDHPLLQRAAFLQPFNERCAARVIAEIRDPRWFVDAGVWLDDSDDARPNRIAKLSSFMGLSESTYTAMSVGENSPRIDRLAAACGVWYSTSPYAGLRDFIRPVAIKYETNAKSAVRGSTKFLKYLVANWLDLLYPDMTERLFESKLFFETDTACLFDSSFG